MNEISEYIDVFFYKEFLKKSYIFIPDENLFVIDKLDKILVQFKDVIQIKLETRNTRRLFLNNLIETINDIKSLVKNDEDRKKIIILCKYQLFLDNNKLDNRSKKRVRELFTKEFLNKDKGIVVAREKHFFNSEKINLIFIDRLNDLTNQINLLSNMNYELFYRGHSDVSWDLLPSIYRNEWINNEHKMFREIIIRNSEEFSKTKSTFEKLTIMQHYGLPTRLLDITKNPLVALFFACEGNTQSNLPGEVFIFKPEPSSIKYYDSDTVSILSNIAKAERNLKFIKNKDKFNTDYEAGLKLLHLIKEEKPYFMDIINPVDLTKTLIVKPINNNDRIKRQLGYFFIFGINNTVSQPAKINSIYVKDGVTPKFIIEDNNKASILFELENLGISMNTLFPEIDKGADYIKSKF